MIGDLITYEAVPTEADIRETHQRFLDAIKATPRTENPDEESDSGGLSIPLGL